MLYEVITGRADDLVGHQEVHDADTGFTGFLAGFVDLVGGHEAEVNQHV